MTKKAAILITIILFSLGVCLAQNPAEPHFGLCGPSPSQSPSVYKLWLDSGARITWWGPRWPELLDPDGKLNFARQARGGINLEKEINTVVSDGGIVVLHLHTAAGWSKVRNEIGNFGRKQSSPPNDMKEYYDFIYQTVQHFKGKVKYYEIENEPYLQGTWSGTNQEYFQLLKTAYQAAHAADPNVKITNGGMAMGCLVTYKINELLQQGKINEAQEAHKRLGIDLYVSGQEMRGARPEGPRSGRQIRRGGPPGQRERETSDIERFVSTKNARRIIDFVDYLFKEGYRYVDILEFHAYNDYQATEEVLAYTKSKMRQYGWADKPIRMKVGWNYRANLSEEKHAQDVVKIFSIVFGAGVDKAIWFTIQDGQGQPNGLITPELQIKPAYSTFKLTVQKLEGFSSVEKLSLRQDIYAFKFIKANKPVYVLWSENNKAVKLPFKSGAKITDIYGQETLAKTENGQLNLDLTTTPIFVESSL